MTDKTIKAGDVTLYWGSGSPPCFRVMIALEEKGLGGYNSKLMLFSKKEHKCDEVTSLNPRGQFPTMKINVGDQHVIVNESLAAILFLEYELHGSGTNLIPCDIIGKALVLQRMTEAENFHQKGVVKLAAKRMFAEKGAPPPELTDEKAAFVEELTIWEGYLNKGGPFLCSANFTAADVFMFPTLAFLVRIGLKLAPRFPCLAKYYELMKERPSVQAAWPPHWRESTGADMLADV